jgi:hypothetical protein
MTIAGLIGVVALLAGVIIGILIPTGTSQPAVTTPTTPAVSAPELTPEQLQNGELPQGHPEIGGGTTGGTPTETPTP